MIVFELKLVFFIIISFCLKNHASSKEKHVFFIKTKKKYTNKDGIHK